MLRTGLTALLLLALLPAASCGGSMATAHDAAFIPVASLDFENSMGADNAQIALLPITGSYEVKVSGLEDAKAVYATVEYDSTLVHLTEAAANDGSPALADGTVVDNNQLVMVVDQPENSRVLIGMVLGNWPERAGIDGELTLATLTFASGSSPVVRNVSTPPEDKVFNAIDLQATKDGAGKAVLTWKEALAGDGGNDGEVGLPDLTPLGAKLNDDSGSSPANDADYDKNGLPTIADLSALGSQIGCSLGGYKVMASPTPTGTFTLVEEIPRNTEFPSKPPLGEVTWDWTSPAPLTADTSFKVVPFDATSAKTEGAKHSDVETLTGQPTQTITDITEITFDDPDSVVLDNGGTPQIIITEESLDGIADNVPVFALEHLQLHAIGKTSEDPGNDVDITDGVLWYVTSGGGLATVDNTLPGRGDLTFHDRGEVIVTAQVPGNFTKTKSITFQLLSIEAVDLQGPGASPISVNAGGSVQFTVEGTFDSDNNSTSGNEQVVDITPYVSWAMGQTFGADGIFNINVGTGELEVDGAATTGSSVNISAEYPRTDFPLLNDNLKRVSPLFQVTVN